VKYGRKKKGVHMVVGQTKGGTVLREQITNSAGPER